MTDRKCAIAVPSYSDLGIKGPYFGDLVHDQLEMSHPGVFEKIYMVVKPAGDSSEEVVFSEHAREREVYVMHPCITNAAQHVMVAAETSDNLHRSDAHRVILFDLYNRYFSYDKRKMKQSLNAKLVADIYQGAHVDRVFTVDPHSSELVGFFSEDCPLEPLPMAGPLGDYFRQRHELSNVTVCSPDVGGYPRAERFARSLGLPLVGVRKSRSEDVSDKTEALEIVGDRRYIEGKTILFRDDVIRSGGSLEEAAGLLRDAGANDFYAAVTHLELCGDAVGRLKKSGIKVVGTNTIPHTFEGDDAMYFDVMDISGIIAEVVRRRSQGLSIGQFFRYSETGGRH